MAAHGVAGEVLRLGPGVQDIIPGERYAVQSIVGCGECDFCFRARENLCPRAYHIHGFGEAGAYAEEFIVPAEAIAQGCLIPLPDGMDADSGLFIEPLAFCMNAMNNLPISSATRLVVIGAGIPGILCGMIGRYRKARRVAVVDPDARRIETLRPLGLPFDALIAGGDDAVAKLLAESDGGVEAIVVTIPDGAAVRRAVALSAIGGHISFLVPAEVLAGAAPIDPVAIARRELHIHGACGANRADYMEARHMVAEGFVPAAQLISHRFSIGELKSAMEVLLDSSALVREVILEIPATLTPPAIRSSAAVPAGEEPVIAGAPSESASSEEDELSLYFGGVPMSDGNVAEFARRVREPEFHYGPGSDVGPSGQISPWPDLPEEYLQEREAERQRRLQRDSGRGRDRRERGRGRGEIHGGRSSAPAGDGGRSRPAGGPPLNRGIGQERAGRTGPVRSDGGRGEAGRRESGRRGRGRRGRGRERLPVEDRVYPEGGPLPDVPGPEFQELLAPEEAFTFEIPSPPTPFEGPSLGSGGGESDDSERDLRERNLPDISPDDAVSFHEPGEDREEERVAREESRADIPSAENFLLPDPHSGPSTGPSTGRGKGPSKGLRPAARSPEEKGRRDAPQPPETATPGDRKTPLEEREIRRPLEKLENAPREKRGRSRGRRSSGQSRSSGRTAGGDRRQTQRGGEPSVQPPSQRPQQPPNQRSEKPPSPRPAQRPPQRAPRGPAQAPESGRENEAPQSRGTQSRGTRSRGSGQDRRGEPRGGRSRSGGGGGRAQGGRAPRPEEGNRARNTERNTVKNAEKNTEKNTEKEPVQGREENLPASDSGRGHAAPPAAPTESNKPRSSQPGSSKPGPSKPRREGTQGPPPRPSAGDSLTSWPDYWGDKQD